MTTATTKNKEPCFAERTWTVFCPIHTANQESDRFAREVNDARRNGKRGLGAGHHLTNNKRRKHYLDASANAYGRVAKATRRPLRAPIALMPAVVGIACAIAFMLRYCYHFYNRSHP